MKGFNDDGYDNNYFEVTGTEIMVSDPCYENPTWCQHIVKNALPGKWTADFMKVRMEPSSNDHRIAEITAWNTEKHSEVENGTWEIVSDVIGVDSGQAGIFDLAHYKDDKVVPKEWEEKIANGICSDDPWYAMSCHVTLGSVGAGYVPYGFVSRSGYGDGSYQCKVVRHEGKVVAIRIDFFPRDDEE